VDHLSDMLVHYNQVYHRILDLCQLFFHLSVIMPDFLFVLLDRHLIFYTMKY
jgi:hypothetical protein